MPIATPRIEKLVKKPFWLVDLRLLARTAQIGSRIHVCDRRELQSEAEDPSHQDLPRPDVQKYRHSRQQSPALFMVSGVKNPWLDPDGRTFRGGVVPNNPLRDAQVDLLVRLASVRTPRRVLDLGCGPGHVAAVLPGKEFVLLDASPAMLEEARRRMPDARLVHARLEDGWDLGAPFDLVVTVQAAHHVADKRAFYRRVHDVVAPGGLFLQSDPVAPHRDLLPHHTAIWNALRTGAGFEPLPDDYDFDAHMERQGDRLATVEDQLAWLREAGFRAADCFWRHGNRAVWGALK